MKKIWTRFLVGAWSLGLTITKPAKTYYAEENLAKLLKPLLATNMHSFDQAVDAIFSPQRL